MGKDDDGRPHDWIVEPDAIVRASCDLGLLVEKLTAYYKAALGFAEKPGERSRARLAVAFDEMDAVVARVMDAENVIHLIGQDSLNQTILEMLKDTWRNTVPFPLTPARAAEWQAVLRDPSTDGSSFFRSMYVPGCDGFHENHLVDITGIRRVIHEWSGDHALADDLETEGRAAAAQWEEAARSAKIGWKSLKGSREGAEAKGRNTLEKILGLFGESDLPPGVREARFVAEIERKTSGGKSWKQAFKEIAEKVKEAHYSCCGNTVKNYYRKLKASPDKGSERKKSNRGN